MEIVTTIWGTCIGPICFMPFEVWYLAAQSIATDILTTCQKLIY